MKEPFSYVDVLAKSLSEATGCEYRVVRQRTKSWMASDKVTVTTRYSLYVCRSDGGLQHGTMFFRSGISVNQMKDTLAMMSDCIHMGFIRKN